MTRNAEATAELPRVPDGRRGQRAPRCRASSWGHAREAPRRSRFASISASTAPAPTSGRAARAAS